jgi:hypothetical protein
MQPKLYNFMIGLIALSLILTACGGGEAAAPTQPAAIVSTTAPVATEAPAATAIPAGPTLGEEQRAPQGGFAFLNIPGYVATNEGDFISIEAPNAQPAVGPGIVFLGGPNTHKADVTQTFSDFTQQFTDVSVVAEEDVTLQNFLGKQNDFTAKSDGKDVRGRFIGVASPDNSQILVVLALTPPDQWEATEPYINAVTESVTFFEPEGPAVEVLRQWAVSDYATSVYSEYWSSANANGEPDSTACDVTATGAWAPASNNQQERLELEYVRPVSATELNIYLIDNPAQLVKVEVADLNGNYTEVWGESLTETGECPQVLNIPLANISNVATVIMTVDTSIEGSGFEIGIDAVELVGELPVPDPLPAGLIEQWATGATFSSSYYSDGDQALLGPQDVFRCGGYSGRTWASEGDNTVEWFEVTFDTPVVPSQIEIYEAAYYSSGQIVKVELLDVNGTYHEIYTDTPEALNECPSKVTIYFGEEFTEKVNAVKVTVDQSVLGVGNAYIDAVSLVGTP